MILVTCGQPVEACIMWFAFYKSEFSKQKLSHLVTVNIISFHDNTLWIFCLIWQFGYRQKLFIAVSNTILWHSTKSRQLQLNFLLVDFTISYEDFTLVLSMSLWLTKQNQYAKKFQSFSMKWLLKGIRQTLSFNWLGYIHWMNT